MTTLDPPASDIVVGANLPAPHAAEALKRAEGLWFEDGSPIIRAQNTLFRVYRHILAVHSPLPWTVEYFLKALFDYRFFDPYPAYTTFPILFGVLRMNHKYQVEGLRLLTLEHQSRRDRKSAALHMGFWSISNPNYRTCPPGLRGLAHPLDGTPAMREHERTGAPRRDHRQWGHS
ncbi:hypothetical protein DFH09DRAFT_1280149 [Mycena vulgaris]|nr:hypothetical protein DFH09DRAFT_1280149 [Mycena vulgaris]